jgi:putative SOS response-associated peptidase YedK
MMQFKDRQTLIEKGELPEFARNEWPTIQSVLYPSQSAIAVLNENPDAAVRARWGLVPAWAKDEKIARHTFNARAESVAEKPAFRDAFRKRRCLVLASGFIEWRKRPKQPLLFERASGAIMAFAGLWERWRDITTCTVITTGPNELMEPIHNRMPVILHETDFSNWLAGDQPADLLKPFPSEEMKYAPFTIPGKKKDDNQTLLPL